MQYYKCDQIAGRMTKRRLVPSVLVKAVPVLTYNANNKWLVLLADYGKYDKVSI